MKKSICSFAAIAALTLAGASTVQAETSKMTKQHIVSSSNAASSDNGLLIVGLLALVLVAASVASE